MAVTSELCTDSRESLAQRENEKKGKEENEGLFDPSTQATLIDVNQIQEKFLEDHKMVQLNDKYDVTNLMIKDDDSTNEAIKKMQANSKKPKCDT